MMTGIVEGLAEAGHEIRVVTSLPFYRQNKVEADWVGDRVQHQEMPWGRVTRVEPFAANDKRSIPKRALGFGAFTALTTWRAVVDRWKPDVVLAMAPPITLGLAGWLAARRRRVPYVFNVQDVFPDVTVELGVLTNPKLISFFSALERFTYRRADVVTTLTDDMRQNIVGKLGAKWESRVRVIPNFVDSEAIRPGDRANSYRTEFGLDDQTVVMYTGNIGFSQPLDLLLGAAEANTGRDDVVFVLNGDGSARPGLEERAAHLANVRFVDFQPGERMPEVLAAADIHVVPLARGLSGSSVPSKFYAILAAARPVVVSVDEGSELHRVLDEVPAGLAVPPEDQLAFTSAISELLDDPDRRSAMGAAGRAWIESWSSTARIGQHYAQLFAELVEQ